jgi:hypothetical protein
MQFRWGHSDFSLRLWRSPCPISNAHCGFVLYNWMAGAGRCRIKKTLTSFLIRPHGVKEEACVIYSFIISCVPTGCYAQIASYLMVAGLLSRGVSLSDCEAKHSSLSSAKVKNEWSGVSTSPYAFVTSTRWNLTFLYVLYFHIVSFWIMTPCNNTFEKRSTSSLRVEPSRVRNVARYEENIGAD